MRDFDVQFGTPSHGWMSVGIFAGDHHWHADVSDVPCDSLRSLVLSLSMLVQGAYESTIDWSLEPDYAQWRFCRIDTTMELEISKPQSNNLQLLYRGDVSAIVGRLIKGLCDLASNDCWSLADRPTRIWSWGFPKDELARLKTFYAELIA